MSMSGSSLSKPYNKVRYSPLSMGDIREPSSLHLTSSSRTYMEEIYKRIELDSCYDQEGKVTS